MHMTRSAQMSAPKHRVSSWVIYWKICQICELAITVCYLVRLHSIFRSGLFTTARSLRIFPTRYEKPWEEIIEACSTLISTNVSFIHRNLKIALHCSRSSKSYFKVWSGVSVFSCIFLLLSREIDQSPMTSSRRTSKPAICLTPRWGILLIAFSGGTTNKLADPTRNQSQVYISRGGRSYHSAIVLLVPPVMAVNSWILPSFGKTH